MRSFIPFPSFYMSCCTLPKDSQGIAKFVFVKTFGFALLFIGLKHLMTVDGFAEFVAADLGPLAPLGSLWAYVYSVLLIVGGALYVLDKYAEYAAWCAGIALGSVVVGMLLKPLLGGAELGAVMPSVHNTWIWMLAYLMTLGCGKK
jgi:hypothetical protein